MKVVGTSLPTQGSGILGQTCSHGGWGLVWTGREEQGSTVWERSLMGVPAASTLLPRHFRVVQLRGSPPSCYAQLPKAQHLATRVVCKKLKGGPSSRSLCSQNQVNLKAGTCPQFSFAFPLGFMNSKLLKSMGSLPQSISGKWMSSPCLSPSDSEKGRALRGCHQDF